jgi:hypothetical protein
LYFSWFFEQDQSGEVRTYVVSAPQYKRPTTNTDFEGWMLARGNRGWVADPSPFPFIAHDPAPRDFDAAIAKAIEWAERIEEYVMTSGEFQNL